jgi:hypothetical protein
VRLDVWRKTIGNGYALTAVGTRRWWKQPKLHLSVVLDRKDGVLQQPFTLH